MDIRVDRRALAVVALAGTGVLIAPADSVTIGLVLFGAVNAALSGHPHTKWVARTAVVVSFVALLVPGDSRTILGLLACLVWPPALLVAWAVGAAESGADRPKTDAGRRARAAVAAIIGATALGSLAYRGILGHGLEQTAALFIGLPALMAIVVVFAVSPRSATGVACKAVTIGLLVSLLFLWEGIVCVLMSAPLFYAVAVIIGATVDWARRDFSRHTSTAVSCLAVLAFVPMSLEGVTDLTTLDRRESVSVTRLVPAAPHAVERALFERPRFDRARPPYLLAGFPRPVAARIDHHTSGTRWTVRFSGGEMKIDGMEPRAGDLVLHLVEVRPGFVRWRAQSDDSHMTHFLRWREAIVQWEPAGTNATSVTWTLTYSRDLDPAWYFGPWQRYAVGLAAEYLIDTVATP